MPDYQARLAKLRAEMPARGADAAIVSSEVNRRYFTGFHSSDGYVILTPRTAYLLVDFRYYEAAASHIAGISAGGVIEPLLAEGGFAPKIAGLLRCDEAAGYLYEDEELSCAAFKRLSGAIETGAADSGTSGATGEAVSAGFSPIPAGGRFDDIRAVKDADEIGAIARAQEIADAAFDRLLKSIKPSMTETEIALELEYLMRRGGAEAAAFDTICVSGSASSLPHGVPRPRPLERGFLTLDFGAVWNGYRSDMTRTVCVGPADVEMKRLYTAVLEAQRRALDAIRPGALCREADAAAREYIDGFSEYKGCFGHAAGHGVGLRVHESPRLSRLAGERRLEPGNVVTVEPGIYIGGKYGCRIEDMAVVTDDGIRNFTRGTKELIEI